MPSGFNYQELRSESFRCSSDRSHSRAHLQDSRSRFVSIHSKTSLPPTFVKQLVRPNKYNQKINVESSVDRPVHVSSKDARVPWLTVRAAIPIDTTLQRANWYPGPTSLTLVQTDGSTLSVGASYKTPVLTKGREVGSAWKDQQRHRGEAMV
jgi:hypothetical protein